MFGIAKNLSEIAALSTLACPGGARKAIRLPTFFSHGRAFLISRCQWAPARRLCEAKGRGASEERMRQERRPSDGNAHAWRAPGESKQDGARRRPLLDVGFGQLVCRVTLSRVSVAQPGSRWNPAEVSHPRKPRIHDQNQAAHDGSSRSDTVGCLRALRKQGNSV